MVKKLIKEIIQILDDKKGEHIILLDLKKVTTFTDYFIMTTANSETHAYALAKEMMKKIKEGFKRSPINPVEHSSHQWILLDYQDVIVHIFTQEAREYYDLETLWFEAKKIDYKIL